MTATPAFHPQCLELHPDTAPVPPSGGAMPAGQVKGRVESVPCSADFDKSEARTYAGMLAADLVEHAKDIEAMKLEKPLRMGSTARFQDRVSEFTDGVLQRALSAYLTVKSAMRLIARPLQNRVRREPSHSTDPVAPKVWVTKAPTKAEWAARDVAAGYDIRGTSPTWVMRRAYRHRTRRRLDLEPPHETAYRLGQKAQAPTRGTADFIGPPKPLHYKEVQDLHQIWPPVELPKGPKGMLPLLQDLVLTSEDAVEGRRATAPACANLSHGGRSTSMARSVRGSEIEINLQSQPIEHLIRALRAHLLLIEEGSAGSADARLDGTADGSKIIAVITHINDLIEGYNFALEQFGDDATYNYLRGLTDKDAALMDRIINYHRKKARTLNPKNKEPPDD